MSRQPQPRILRYSRPPSLSTISSNEEADFQNSDRGRGLPLSPYTGGASNRNSIVSPLSAQGCSPSSALAANSYGGLDTGLPPYPALDNQGYQAHQNFPALHNASVMQHRATSDDNSDTSSFYSNEEKSINPTHTEPSSDRSRQVDLQSRTNTTTTLVERSVSPSMASEKGTFGKECDEGKYKQTEWMWMLLQLDEIPWWHNLLAATSAWIILAAYIVLPGTFTKLKASDLSAPPPGQSQTQLENIAHTITNSIDHLGLAVFSAILASIGAFGCFLMWFVHFKNYLWLGMKIFMPVMLNSYAGLLTTIVSVYTAQDKVWSLTAKVNAIVSGSVAGLATLFYCLYTYVLLNRVKKEHRKMFPDDSHMVDPMRTVRARRIWARRRKLFAQP